MSKEQDKYHMALFVCGILKNYTNELIYKTERVKKKNRKSLIDFRNKLMVPKEEREEEG